MANCNPKRRSKPQSSVAHRFARSTSGNIAMIFALAMVPMIAAVGGAIDLSRGFLAQQRLANALDAAALAVGSNLNPDTDAMQAMAESFLAANYPDDVVGSPSNLSVSIEGETVTIDASTSIDTAMLGLFGIDTLTLDATTEVIRDESEIEVVLVLDNTGSMWEHGRMDALKAASVTFVDTLFGDETVHPSVKIGIVPFSQTVNVGPQHANASWMDTNARSSIHGENFETNEGQPQNIFDLYDQMPGTGWRGCVETRPAPYDTRDARPTSTNGDTLWVPWFNPDEPGEPDEAWEGYGYSYLDDGIDSDDPAERQKSLAKYDGAVPGGTEGRTPNSWCSLPAITPLTNRRATITDAIDDLSPMGWTHIPIGLAWGWRVISPREPFTEGATYDTPDTKKVIILLTDGENTISTRDNHNGSSYTAYGYLAKGRLGTTNYETAVRRLDNKTTRLCNRIKARSIRLYTVTFQVPTDDIKDLMRDCATEDDLFFDSPTNEELSLVFRAIARDLSNLRISR